MTALLRVTAVFDRIVMAVGRLGAWMILPLVAIIVFDILTRKFYWSQQLISNSFLFDYVSSQILQDLEWQFHTILFLLALGWTYLVNGHIRVDLVREKLSERGQVWIEFIGCLIFLLPYTILLLYFAWPFVLKSWTLNEQSASFSGIGHRWAIKSFLLLGFALAVMAGLSMLVRCAAYLFGPAHLRDGLYLPFLTDREDGSPRLPEIEPYEDDDTPGRRAAE